ncbi:MAG: hypothetical protein ABIL22_04315 [candidate division WOR-3 bacterium]
MGKLRILSMFFLVVGFAFVITCGEKGEEQEITLQFGEGYNFKDSLVDTNFLNVDFMYAFKSGDTVLIIESRSAMIDEGDINLEDATPVPDTSITTNLEAVLNHVYAFKAWSISDTTNVAIKIISLSPDSLTFRYRLGF